jgi:hypothetical protein
MDERLLILEQEPTFTRPTWLPESSPWPELDKLHADHVRLLEARQQAAQAVSAVRQRHEREDEARREALTAAIREGRDADELPSATSAEQRDAEVREAMQNWDAATHALAALIKETLAALNEHARAWLDDVGSHVAEARQRREEAQRVLDEADEAVRKLGVLDLWLRRSTGRHNRGHYPFGEMAVPPADLPPDLGNILGYIGETDEEPDDPNSPWREDLDPIEPTPWLATVEQEATP